MTFGFKHIPLFKKKAIIILAGDVRAHRACRMARLNGDRDLRRFLVRRDRTLQRKDKEQFIKNLA